MTTLYQKILIIYPALKQIDFDPIKGTIGLQNNSDGRGDFIRYWNNSVYPQPTQAQLDAIP